MKKLNVINTVFSFSLLASVFIIDGCKKETAVKPIVTPPAVISGPISPAPAVDSSNYLKGYLGTEVVKFEGNAVAYNAYVDPDSAQGPGGHQGNGHDDDSYFMSGSKWMSINSSGVQSTHASVELRSLAVRVFVSPLQAISTTYYNLIKQATYQFSTDDNPSKGAYVSLYDQSGVLWTSAGDQDGSTLTVTTVGADMNTYTVITGTISCKMYDPYGNMKQLTGATFTAALGI